MQLDQRAMDFLMARGLEPETAVRLGWYSQGNELVIPYYDGDQIVNRKYKNLDTGAWRQDKDGAKILYNRNVLFDIDDRNDLIVTEGEFDTLACVQSGFPNTVSVPDGAPAEALGADYDGAKYSYLDNGTLTLMRQARRIVIASDADAPGQNLANDLSLRIGRSRCGFVTYPDRCKDANDVLRYGPDALVEMLTGAKWWAKPSVRRMTDIPPAPYRSAFLSGVDGFDDLFRWRMGDLSVWTGVPGHGKSTFLNHVISASVIEQEWNVTFASFEQDPATDHRRALRSWFMETSPEHASKAQIAEADRWIERHFSFACPDLDSNDEMLNLAWLLDCMEAAAVRFQSKIFVVDPWNELEHDKPRDMSLTEYVGAAIRTIRQKAHSLNIHAAIVAHPAKMGHDDGPPGLYAISDSAHWANKPDLGACVFRDEWDITTFRTLKCRYEILGKLGSQDFTFNPMTKRYRAISRDEADYIRTGSA